MTSPPASGPSDIALHAAILDERLLELLPAAAYVCDAGGHLLRFNRRAAEFWGRTPGPGDADELFCGECRLVRRDGRISPPHETPTAEVLRTGTSLRNEEVRIERADGSRRCILVNIEPILDAEGRVTGAVNCFHDVTLRKESGHPDEPGGQPHAVDRLVELGEIRKVQVHMQHLASIVESSEDAIISKDTDGIIQSWNRGAERLFGYTADEVVGRFIGVLIPADRQHEEPEILARIRRGERVEHYETVRRRKDGTLLDISISVSPLRDAGGAIVGASKIARDITERKRHERRQQLLIHELNHRVKNTLAMVQSIAAHTFRADAGNAQALEFESRVLALAKAHDLLTRESWVGASLREIVTAVIAPVCAQGERVEVAGVDVYLRPQTTLSIAMALHELCTNAAKYGALSTPEGRVRLEWRLARSAAPPRLQLRWTERDGPPVREPGRQGFGTRLLQRVLAHELDARVHLSFAPSGLCYALDAPLAAVQEAAHDRIDSTA